MKTLQQVVDEVRDSEIAQSIIRKIFPTCEFRSTGRGMGKFFLDSKCTGPLLQKEYESEVPAWHDMLLYMRSIGLLPPG